MSYTHSSEHLCGRRELYGLYSLRYMPEIEPDPVQVLEIAVCGKESSLARMGGGGMMDVKVVVSGLPRPNSA